MAIVQEALQHSTFSDTEYAFLEVLSHIHDNAIRIFVPRDTVLVEVFRELVINVAASAIEIDSPDLAVADDPLADDCICWAVVNDPVDTRLDAFSGTGDFFVW